MLQFDLQLLYIVLLVIYLEGVLSIDNAAVLGAMVSVLPQHEGIPWPPALRWLAKPMHRLLGGQRGAALKVGLLGAYIGRGSMLFLANFVIQNPWLKLLGGLYLIKLALENLGEAEPGEEEQVDIDRVSQKSFWGIVLGVELADLAFSLDNVVAVVAISNNLWLVMFGVAMGILTMRFAAGIFTRLIAREPILKPAAYVLVFNIGVELLLEEGFGFHVDSIATLSISVATLVLAVMYSRIKQLHALRPVLHWLGEGMADLNELSDWALIPILGLLQLAFKGIARVVRAVRPTRIQSASSQSGSAEAFSDPPEN